MASAFLYCNLNCTKLWRGSAVANLVAHRRTRTATYSTWGKDRPKPFLNSEAHRFKVMDAYVLTEKEQKRGRFAIPIGLAAFGVVVYMGFIREYGHKDKSKVGFLLQDISDKLPPQTYNKIKKKLEEEKKWTKGNS